MTIKADTEAHTGEGHADSSSTTPSFQVSLSRIFSLHIYPSFMTPGDLSSTGQGSIASCRRQMGAQVVVARSRGGIGPCGVSPEKVPAQVRGRMRGQNVPRCCPAF